jgi:hypothetical protein
MPPLVYDDFSPLLLSQYVNADTGYVALPTFAAAVDEYYSRYEARRSVAADLKSDDQLEKKKLKIERDQARRSLCVRRRVGAAVVTASVGASPLVGGCCGSGSPAAVTRGPTLLRVSHHTLFARCDVGSDVLPREVCLSLADLVYGFCMPQEERVALLRQQQDGYRACGARIEMHLTNVDNAISVVRSALDSKMDWCGSACCC